MIARSSDLARTSILHSFSGFESLLLSLYRKTVVSSAYFSVYVRYSSLAHSHASKTAQIIRSGPPAEVSVACSKVQAGALGHAVQNGQRLLIRWSSSSLIGRKLELTAP